MSTCHRNRKSRTLSMTAALALAVHRQAEIAKAASASVLRSLSTSRVAPPNARRRGIKEKQGVRGVFEFELIGKDGRTKKRWKVDNLVVDAGLDWIREYAFDSVTPTALVRMNRIGIGTGTASVSAADTDLQTSLVRQVFTAVTGYAAGGTGVVTVLTTFAAGTGTGAITEAGVFNANAAGQMWNRVVFPAVNKGAGDTLKVTVTITFTSS